MTILRPFTVTMLALALAPFGQLGRADDNPEQGKIVKETWEVALINGQKVGHTKFTVEEFDQGGGKLLRGTRDLMIKLKRGDGVATLDVKVQSVETPDGAVLRTGLLSNLGQQQDFKVVGDVDGDQVTVVTTAGDQEPFEKVNPWPEGTIGLIGELNLFTSKKPEPGSEFSYRYFEPQVGAVVTVNVKVGDAEQKQLPNGAVLEMLKVTSLPEKIGGVQLPQATTWLDPESYDPLLTETEMPGLGQLTTFRTTKAIALAAFVPKVDTFNQSIRLKNRIEVGDVHRLARVVYSAHLPEDKGDDDDPPIPSDDRQRVVVKEDGTLEVRVDAIRAPRKLEKVEPAGEEFLASNTFINSADPRVKALAEEAVGGDTDDWAKARRIERWVKQNMRVVDFSEAMATADHVAKTLRGDCTEFAMLTAAMCRAAGVPSRTAIGVIYVDHGPNQPPVLAYHMWTEVYVKGQWLAIDATLGNGSVGPGHIKITDHSWHETRNFMPLLPVLRFLIGKPEVKVVGAYVPSK